MHRTFYTAGGGAQQRRHPCGARGEAHAVPQPQRAGHGGGAGREAPSVHRRGLPGGVRAAVVAAPCTSTAHCRRARRQAAPACCVGRHLAAVRQRRTSSPRAPAPATRAARALTVCTAARRQQVQALRNAAPAPPEAAAAAAQHAGTSLLRRCKRCGRSSHTWALRSCMCWAPTAQTTGRARWAGRSAALGAQPWSGAWSQASSWRARPLFQPAPCLELHGAASSTSSTSSTSSIRLNRARPSLPSP